jgi:putative iron-dependent peroxidase
MHSGQPGILVSGSRAAKFIVLDVTQAMHTATVARVLASIPERCARLRAAWPNEFVHCTVSFSSSLLRTLGVQPLPRELEDFQALEGGGYRMPATGGDVLLHIHGSRADLCFELATQLRIELGEHVRIKDEVDGFMYLDERDLTGFIDGTENPHGDERIEVAFIGEEDAPLTGGSYVFAMRFVHDLAKWRGLGVPAQEQVMGRTKADSVEFSDDVKPKTAHIARVVIEEDGEELEIVRHSLPFGGTEEAGLYFLAYCRTRSTFDKMLTRMLGRGDGEEAGVVDALLQFTRATSGAYFFAPSLAQLRALGGVS